MSIGVNGSVVDALISIVIYHVRSYIYPIDLAVKYLCNFNSFM